MIKFNQLKQLLDNDLMLLKNNYLIIIKSFKKDRIIKITMINDEFQIQEDGYVKNKCIIKDVNQCYKYVLKLAKYEFPNSHNLWYQKRKV